jgi:HlyD family secretion protein
MGQTIAVLENGDYVARVARAGAVVVQREAAERRLVNGSRVEERREASATVEEAGAVLENAKADLKRRTELFRSGDISRADLDRHQRDVGVAQARFEAASQRHELVERSTREEDLAGARADLAQARSELAEARALMAKTIIRAPLNGVVLRKHRRTGESITDQPGDPILTLADDSVLRVRVEVDEADVARVHVGQSAYVTAEAYGDRRFTGKVIRIGEILGRKNVQTDEPTERVDSKILETLLELDPGQRLPSGLRVDTYIQVY